MTKFIKICIQFSFIHAFLKNKCTSKLNIYKSNPYPNKFTLKLSETVKMQYTIILKILHSFISRNLISRLQKENLVKG